MRIKLISYFFLFGCVIYSGFGIYQSLNTITQNYYNNLATFTNAN